MSIDWKDPRKEIPEEPCEVLVQMNDGKRYLGQFEKHFEEDITLENVFMIDIENEGVLELFPQKEGYCILNGTEVFNNESNADGDLDYEPNKDFYITHYAIINQPKEKDGK